MRRDGLDGVWLERGDTKLGSEYLTAGTGLPRDLLGRYTIARGTNPDGSKYTGTCLVGAGASPGFLTLTWTIGGTSMKGLGIRTTQTATSDVVTAGFSNSGTNFGVTQYMIDAAGKTLTGRWAQAINPASISTGTETLSRP